jgi:hypothetical protein
LALRLRASVPVPAPDFVSNGSGSCGCRGHQNAAGQNAGRAPEPDLAGHRIGAKLGLHRLKQIAVEDRLMLRRMFSIDGGGRK